MPSPRRAAPLAIALAVLAACEDTQEPFSCPGVPAGSFQLAYAEAPAGVDVGGATVVSGCVPRQDGTTQIPAGTYVPPGLPPSFAATITLEGTDDAAFCAPRTTRFGARTGPDLVFADVTFEGAIVSKSDPGPGVCGENCPVRLVEKLGGTLCGGPDWPACPSAGTAVEFHGYVVDEFDVPESVAGGPTFDCGACRGTCRAVWLLDGTSVP